MPTDVIVSLLTVLGVFIANAALIIPMFLWVRAETRADNRHNEVKLESTRELVRAIHDEVKDFHSRLLDLEKRNKS